jgi:hypothetical protein
MVPGRFTLHDSKKACDFGKAMVVVLRIMARMQE